MTVRFKTFREFLKDIRIVHSGEDKQGITILCPLNAEVLLKTAFPVWGDRKTKNSFLMRLYFQKVLIEGRMPQGIAINPAYKWIGRRVKWGAYEHVIVDAWQGVHKDDGDLQWCFKIYPTVLGRIGGVNHPFDVTENKITFL